jgi:GTP-binding protein
MANITNIDNFFKGECKFIMGACNYSHIKESRLPEVAFIGRSNVGKSTLINSLLKQKIALTSKTPGRTRQLNFFELNQKLIIVDMPGYGYAKVSKTEVSSWQKLSYEYFAKRVNLKRVFLLIDARRGPKDSDLEMMNIFDTLAISYQIILTKVDELRGGDLEKIIEKTKNDSKKFPALHPKIIATSSNKNISIDDLKKEIVNLI